MYFCKVCSKSQTSVQPRFREPNLKCKNKNNACLRGPPQRILRCRKCRYQKCIKVGMPAPIIRPFGSFKISLETATVFAYTIDTLLLTAALHPLLFISYLKKENQTIFDISFDVAKNCSHSSPTHSPKIQCLTNLLQKALFDVRNELKYLCFICVCKFNFRNHLPTSAQQGEMQKLQNAGFRKLENDKTNISILFEWIKISKQCLNIIEFFSFV